MDVPTHHSTAVWSFACVRGPRGRAGHAEAGKIAAYELFVFVKYRGRVHTEGRQ